MASDSVDLRKTFILFYEEPKLHVEGAKGQPGFVTKHRVSRNPSLLREFATDFGFVHQEDKEHPFWAGTKRGPVVGKAIRILSAYIEEGSEFVEADEDKSDQDPLSTN